MADTDKEVEIKRPEPPKAPVAQVAIIADRDLYLSSDERTIVEKGDTKARFLLAARGSQIDPPSVARFGLAIKGGKIVQKSAEELAEEGHPPRDLGTPNEGQLRAPGEPLIMASRTGVMRPEPAPRVVPEPGTEINPNPPSVAVSNVPPGDDALRAKVAEETKGEGVEEEEKPAKPAARRAGARRAGRKGR